MDDGRPGRTDSDGARCDSRRQIPQQKNRADLTVTVRVTKPAYRLTGLSGVTKTAWKNELAKTPPSIPVNNSQIFRFSASAD